MAVNCVFGTWYETQIKANLNLTARKMSIVAKLYDRLMRFNKQIRFAAVVDSRGRIIEGGMREGVEPIEPLEKTPHLIAKLVSVLKAEDLDEFFGKPEYSILIHEKIVVFIFRAGKKFVLVTAGRKFGMNKIGRLLTVVGKK